MPSLSNKENNANEANLVKSTLNFVDRPKNDAPIVTQAADALAVPVKNMVIKIEEPDPMVLALDSMHSIKQKSNPLYYINTQMNLFVADNGTDFDGLSVYKSGNSIGKIVSDIENHAEEIPPTSNGEYADCLFSGAPADALASPVIQSVTLPTPIVANQTQHVQPLVCISEIIFRKCNRFLIHFIFCS